MNVAEVGGLLRDALVVALKLGGPLLAVSLLVGLLISVVQAVTQINEATLAFVPKLLVLAGTLVVLGPFMLATLDGFARLLFARIVAIGGS